jgi:hypothetical protein
MMIQDRAGNTPEYLAEQTAVLSRRPRQRPEIGSVHHLPGHVPQRYMEINRDKVLKAGVALNDIYTTIGAFLGGILRQRLQPLRPALQGLHPGRARIPSARKNASTSFSSKTRTATACP